MYIAKAELISDLSSASHHICVVISGKFGDSKFNVNYLLAYSFMFSCKTADYYAPVFFDLLQFLPR